MEISSLISYESFESVDESNIDQELLNEGCSAQMITHSTETIKSMNIRCIWTKNNQSLMNNKHRLTNKRSMKDDKLI